MAIICPAHLTDLESFSRIELAATVATSAIARLVCPATITDELVAKETEAKKENFGDQEHVTYVKAVKGGEDGGEDFVGFLRYYTWADEEAARTHPPYKAPPTFQSSVGSEREDSVVDLNGAAELPADEDGVPAPEVVEVRGEDDDDDGGERARKAKKLVEYQKAIHFEIRQRWTKGKKAVYLSMLMVLPEHHGKGYGRLLIAHAMRAARKLELPVYLFSMPATVGFYQRMGFEVLETGQINLAEFGGREEDGTDGVHVATFMGCEIVGEEFEL